MLKSRGLAAIIFALLVVIAISSPTFAQSRQKFTPATFAQNPQKFQKVLIDAPKPYNQLVASIRMLGGRVRRQYKNIDAVAADIPVNAIAALRALVGPEAVSKDLMVPTPRAAELRRGKLPKGKSSIRSIRAKPTIGSSAASSGVDPYVLNTAGVNLPLRNKNGAGIVVAVIDSGLRPGFSNSNQILENSIVGCENFVDDNGDDVLEGSCISNSNDPHGTFIAGLIAAHAEFDLAGAPNLLQSIREHLPSALRDNRYLALRGSAPGAKIYAFRVFAAGANFPESRVMDAIDRVIELRKSGVNIQVCDLSLGNATLFAGRDAFDKAVDKLLANDIVPVVSAGNVGPSSLTISSPSSSITAVGVGASSAAANERIYWDTCNPDPFVDPFCNSGLGGAFGAGLANRPFAGNQTASFSSRGPNADGRLDPDVVANGFGNFGQGYGGPDQIDIASGTSFSAPIVAGVAAVLRQAHPGNTATQIRNAIIASANPKLIKDGSGVLDRGNGLVDVRAADKLLDAGVPDSIPTPDRPSRDVRVNIQRGTDLNVVHGNVTERIQNLKPGERAEILYDVEDKTDQVTITISNFAASANENTFWGDDLYVTIHSAKTSAIHEFGDYYFYELSKDGTFSVDDPETGVMRITISGDWFNGGKVSADVSVTSTKEPLGKITADGRITDGGFTIFPFEVPAGVKRADIRLGWKDDWSHYPTSDIDILAILDGDGFQVTNCGPATPTEFDCVFDPDDPTTATPGAILDDPEKASVIVPAGDNLPKGTWYIYAYGFSVPAGNDKLELRVMLDGKLVKK